MDKCFAYSKNKGCTALKETKCDGCNFYKTKEEAEEGRRMAIERIKSLDKEAKDNINEIYYDGKLEV